MKPLVLDNTLPNSDPFRTATNAGQMRYLTVADTPTLAVFDRVYGDLVHRTNLINDKLTEVVGALNERAAASDVSRFILSSGTVPFLKPVRGVDPENESHLTTKRYVDAKVAVVQTGISTLASDLNAYKAASPMTFQSAWVNYVWQAGAKVPVDLALAALNSKVLDTSAVTSIAIMERLDIAVPTNAVPNPTPIYVYRELSRGTNGFALEDYWLIASSRTVRALIPNLSGYDPSYLNSGYDKLQTPRSRFLRAVVVGNGIDP